MEYGIPIPKYANISTVKDITPLTISDYDTAIENIFNGLVSELGENAYTSDWVFGGDDSHTTYELNLPNFYGASSLTVSWESLIGLKFNDLKSVVPSISTKWTTSWSRMYYATEPDHFISIRPQDSQPDLGMNGSKIAYYDDRVIVYAEYHLRNNNKNGNFKILMDFKKNENSYYGIDTDIYYMSSNDNLNPYVWVKFFEKDNPLNIDVISADRSYFNFQNGSYTLTKIKAFHDETIEYRNNINMNLNTPISTKLISDDVLSFGKLDVTDYYESYKNQNFYDNHNLINKSMIANLGKVSDIDKSEWKKSDQNWIADLNNYSNIKPFVHFKGFIEGKTIDDVGEYKFVYNQSNIIFKTITSLTYDFDEPIDSRDIGIIVDGRRRYIDINKPMIKGYISGKINTSGCSGQLFKIRCYRHSNIDFIGEYDVDVSGNYFIPNLNYLDEYDIMLVDSNSVIETKVSSKRKPILNDEINELKLGVHTSTLNTDLLILFEFSLLKFSYNKTASPWVQDDATLIPKPYEMYYNITTSYSGYINWWEYGKKYYMNSNAHITDVRYIDNNNVINNIIKNAEFEITVTFNHFGHSYNQWNALFACSDSNNQGNFLYIYNDQIYFGAYNKATGTTHQTPKITISRNKVYTAIIKRKGNLITLTVADAVTLTNKMVETLELPSDFVWDFSKIKLGCAWGGSQFWGDFVDFEFRVL